MGSDRRRWVGSLIAAFVLGIGILCLWNGARRIGHPFPGFLLAYNGIVVSVGRSDWSPQLDDKIAFSQVIGVVATPVGSATEIQAYVEKRAPGTAVTYRFRKAAEVFTATVPTRLFTTADFLALYGNYFLVGLAFSLAGLWALWRLGPKSVSTIPFFALCQTSALVLLTAGDVYGPYWFTALYFTAHCLTPACVLHFASTFPEPLGGRGPRIAAITVLYGAFIALALALNLVADSPSLFLPLVYTVYLLLANSILLYLGRLLVSRSSTPEAEGRRAIDLAVMGLLLAASLPAAIFVIYPVIQGFISPIVLVAPLVVFPVVTALAVRASPARAPSPAVGSVSRRLSFLFLAAVETAFLASIASFWLSNSWQQLLDDLSIHHQQEVRAQRLDLNAADVETELAKIESYVQASESRSLIQALRQSLEGGDKVAAQQEVDVLLGRYSTLGVELENRRRWLARMDAALVVGLVLVGVLQAVSFMVAVRRWLIQPIDHLAQATEVIATGDLSYRSRLDSSEEFASLAESINSMAASLHAIQQRVSAERTARERATAAARDNERRRLARELHDGILQDLSAVKLAVERAAKLGEQEGTRGVVDGLIHVIVGLRRVVEDLRPQDLSYVSLGPAIGNYARALAERYGIPLDLDVAGAGDVADWAARDVYRIAQEAISNAIRHGSPRRLGVRISRRGADMVLEVTDDGTGFDPRGVVRGGGLVGMAERAAALGARFEIRSKAGGGTIVELIIPPAQIPATSSRGEGE